MSRKVKGIAAHRADLDARILDAIKAGARIAELVEQFPACSSYIRNVSYKAGVPIVQTPHAKAWPEADIQMLRELNAAGLTYSQIGKRIGRTKGAISGQAGRMGLKAHPNNSNALVARRRKEAERAAAPAAAPVSAPVVTSTHHAHRRFYDDRQPLKAGSPDSWDAINVGLCIEGKAYPL